MYNILSYVLILIHKFLIAEELVCAVCAIEPCYVNIEAVGGHLGFTKSDKGHLKQINVNQAQLT